MYSFRNLFIIVIVMIVISSCRNKQDGPIIDPAPELQAQITKHNSDNNFTTTIDYVEEKNKRSYWTRHDLGEIRLSREVIFEAALENGENIELAFWFSKIEPDTNLLVLGEESLYASENTTWKYKHTEDEINNFYNNFDEVRIIVDQNTVIFYQKSDTGFEISRTEKALVNSKEKTYLEFTCNGKATGWFDPEGEFMYYYVLEDGVFKGVLE